MNQQNNKNFQNQAFEEIFETLSRQIPGMVLSGIVITYIITAGLSVYFIPLSMLISIPAAGAVQFGRFAVVFMDFLNPTGVRSKWPPVVATLATIVALVELYFSLKDLQEVEAWSNSRYWSIYLFGAMVIAFGYILELNFIAKGAEAFGMVTRRLFEQNQRNIQLEIMNAPRVTGGNVAPIIAEARPEIMRELRERQSRKATESDTVAYAIKRQQASLRAYRHKLINGIGNEATNTAGIQRAEAEIARLKEIG
jgi:hypothetical protein